MSMFNENIEEKEKFLKQFLEKCDGIVIAYSGGVDSSYLADVAHEVLGGKAHMVIADSPSLPRAELQEAVSLAKERNWNYHIVRTHELKNEHYRRNDGLRCYYCKLELFRVLWDYARENNISVVAHGANLDDAKDETRVGSKAAIENNVIAPLQLAKMTKADVRFLSRQRNLPTATKPSFACLASRFPRSISVTEEDLKRVEKAEAILRALGFRQYRVRHHHELCRIEVESEDIPRFSNSDIRETVLKEFTALGYRYITLDLAGYRSGSSA